LCATASAEVGLFHFQYRNGRVVGIEVRASSTVRSEDFRHTALMRDRVGADFVAGIVFFTGGRPPPFGGRMLALPISLLWSGKEAPATASATER
jgi:uncharacterized protein